MTAEVSHVLGCWVGVFAIVVGLAAAASPMTVERVEGPLRLSASVGKTTYAIGEVIEATLVAQNTGAGPLTLTFSSGQTFELVVRRPRGDEVWRWSHDKAFTQAFQNRTLKAGEMVSYRGAWDQRDLQGRRVDPGTYEIVAMFLVRLEGSDRRSLSLPPLALTIQQ